MTYHELLLYIQIFSYITIRLYSVVVITFGFDPDNPGSNPGTTFFFARFQFFSTKKSNSTL
ncbi:unnamed protein product [Debaryomyces fabryi]|nr:unnamed protein product [Debaryomyces fabryi]